MAITHETNEYQIPRGRVYFDAFDANDALTGERYLGNCPGFTVSIETEKAEHFSAETGLKQKDKSVVVQVTRTGALTCDNVSLENVALFVSGDTEVVTQTSTTVSNEAITVLQGRHYQIGQTAGNPAGARGISAVTVTDVAGTTTYVAGTDYNLDLDLGRIQIIAGGAIADAAAEIIHVDYTRPAKTWDRVKTGAVSELVGALRVVADNASGDNRDFYMPKVSLAPSGELPVIAEGTDFAQMQFNVEVLKPANAEAIYIDGRPAA